MKLTGRTVDKPVVAVVRLASAVVMPNLVSTLLNFDLSSKTLRKNKLECLAFHVFCKVYFSWIRSGANPRVEHLKSIVLF
jgi:hypothetical protein